MATTVPSKLRLLKKGLQDVIKKTKSCLFLEDLQTPPVVQKNKLMSPVKCHEVSFL